MTTTSITTTVAVGTTTDSAVLLGRAYLRTVRDHQDAYAAWVDDDDTGQRERFEASGDAMNRACLALVDVMVATGRYEVEVDGYNLVQPRGCCADVNWTDGNDAAELIFMIPRSHK